MSRAAGGAAGRLRGWTAVLIALAATAAGVMIVARMVSPTPSAPPAAFGIGDDVPTSFGIVAVEFIRSVDGVNHRALAGATHGVSGLVDADHRQLQVAVALTNRRSRALDYTVRQFELTATTAGHSTTLSATAGDLPDGRILPDAGIEGHLDFTLPAADAALKLRFRDPGAAAAVVIDLGSVGKPGAAPGHSHS
jgi:hypothetical protein